MAKEAMLLFEEGKLLGKAYRPGIRNVKARDRVLALLGIEWVLSNGQGVATGAGAEDLAGIIQHFAPGITSAEAQLLEQVGGPELYLERVIIGEGAIVTLAHQSLIAVHASKSRIWSRQRLRRSLDHSWGCTTGYASRNQVGESLGQTWSGGSTNIRIAVNVWDKRKGAEVETLRKML